VARARLQTLLEYERHVLVPPNTLPQLCEEIFVAISGYVTIDRNKVEVRITRDPVNTLAVNVEIPNPSNQCHSGPAVRTQEPIWGAHGWR